MEESVPLTAMPASSVFEKMRGAGRDEIGAVCRFARRQEDHAVVLVGRAEDQHLGLEAGDVARRKIDDAYHHRADELFGAVVGDLRARPFVAERAEIDAHLPGWVARLGEGLDRHDAARRECRRRRTARE